MVTGTVLLALAGGVGVVVAIVFSVVSRSNGRAIGGRADHVDASDPKQAAALREVQTQIDRGRGPLG